MRRWEVGKHLPKLMGNAWVQTPYLGSAWPRSQWVRKSVLRAETAWNRCVAGNYR